MPTAIADFVKYVRTEVPGCPEPLIDDAVMRTCIDFCTRTELLSEIIELVTSATLPTYAVTPTDADLDPARLVSARPARSACPGDGVREGVRAGRAGQVAPGLVAGQ